MLRAVLLAALLATPQQVRVLTYNIHHGEGVDGKIDLERIAKVVRDADPDLVALQEVDVRTTRSNGVDQAREIAQRAGLHVIFGRTIPFRDGLYGNAVLSRWPVNSFANRELPFTPGREKRGIIEVEAAGFRLLATHLDISEADRLSAIAWIQSHLPAGPLLLAGDLNAQPGSKPIAGLLEEWTSAAPPDLFTFPSEKPTRQIDFILFRPAHRWKVIEAKVLDEPVASDHRPLLVTLQLLPE